jgi:hypothetical protein
MSAGGKMSAWGTAASPTHACVLKAAACNRRSSYCPSSTQRERNMRGGKVHRLDFVLVILILRTRCSVLSDGGVATPRFN